MRMQATTQRGYVMKKLLGSLVAVTLGLFGHAVVARADDQQSEEAAWAHKEAIHPMELVLTPRTKTIYKMRP